MGLEKRELVTPGDEVWVEYDNLHHVPAVVSHVHNREGLISVRISKAVLTPKQIAAFFVEAGGFIGLVLEDDEWEMRRKVAL